MCWDIIVIGGGPAGGMAAYHAAPHARVLVLEAHRLPRRKLCSGVLSPKAMAVLAGTGLPEPSAILGQAMRTWVGSRGRGAVVTHTPYLFVNRALFDLSLLNLAVRRGAQIRQDARVTRVYPTAGAVTLASGETLQAEIIIGADGATGVSAQATGQPLRSGWAIEAPVAVARPLRAAAVDYYSTAGYAWIFPKEGGTAAVGVGSMIPGNKHEALTSLAHLVNAHGIQMPEHFPGHPVPLLPVGRPMVGRLLLAGDAAGLVDPALGEGIPWALASGRLAAAAAIGYLQAGARLDRYAEALRPMRRHHAWSRLVGQASAPGIRLLGPAGGPVLRAAWRILVEGEVATTWTHGGSPSTSSSTDFPHSA